MRVEATLSVLDNGRENLTKEGELEEQLGNLSSLPTYLAKAVVRIGNLLLLAAFHYATQQALAFISSMPQLTLSLYLVFLRVFFIYYGNYHP